MGGSVAPPEGLHKLQYLFYLVYAETLPFPVVFGFVVNFRCHGAANAKLKLLADLFEQRLTYGGSRFVPLADLQEEPSRNFLVAALYPVVATF
jgi:hypothetical protein